MLYPKRRQGHILLRTQDDKQLGGVRLPFVVSPIKSQVSPIKSQPYSIHKKRKQDLDQFLSAMWRFSPAEGLIASPSHQLRTTPTNEGKMIDESLNGSNAFERFVEGKDATEEAATVSKTPSEGPEMKGLETEGLKTDGSIDVDFDCVAYVIVTDPDDTPDNASASEGWALM